MRILFVGPFPPAHDGIGTYNRPGQCGEGGRRMHDYVARAEGSTLAHMATAAHAYAAKLSWHEIGARTKSEMDAVLSCKVRSGSRGDAPTPGKQFGG
jgi:hypothetical protein